MFNIIPMPPQSLFKIKSNSFELFDLVEIDAGWGRFLL